MNIWKNFIKKKDIKILEIEIILLKKKKILGNFVRERKFYKKKLRNLIKQIWYKEYKNNRIKDIIWISNKYSIKIITI